MQRRRCEHADKCTREDLATRTEAGPGTISRHLKTPRIAAAPSRHTSTTAPIVHSNRRTISRIQRRHYICALPVQRSVRRRATDVRRMDHSRQDSAEHLSLAAREERKARKWARWCRWIFGSATPTRPSGGKLARMLRRESAMQIPLLHPSLV